MLDRIQNKIEDIRKEVREPEYRVDIYRYHPNAGKFTRKILMVSLPVLLGLVLLFLSFQRAGSEEGRIIYGNWFVGGLILSVVAMMLLIYWLISPPSCFILFNEKLGEMNHHALIEVLQSYLNLIPDIQEKPKRFRFSESQMITSGSSGNSLLSIIEKGKIIGAYTDKESNKYSHISAEDRKGGFDMHIIKYDNLVLITNNIEPKKGDYGEVSSFTKYGCNVMVAVFSNEKVSFRNMVERASTEFLYFDSKQLKMKEE